jgi:septal ring factor EnvC (AmiA/AmiB activator)
MNTNLIPALLFVIQLLLFAGAIVGIYVRMQTKLKELDMRMSAIEQEVAHTQKQDDKIMVKLDQISEQIFEVKIQLNNKQDRD